MPDPLAAQPGTLPNIVVIMTDQQRQGFTAGEGFPADTMPYVDSLATAGTRLHRAYTTAPACVPARTSMLTGRFPTAHRVRQNSADQHVYRADDLLDVLSAAGYSTHLAGKPHIYRRAEDFDSYTAPYMHEEGPPGRADEQERAFERWLRDLDHGVSNEPTPFPLECQLPHRIVTDAIRTLDTTDPDRPFFLWLSFPEPHNPYQVPEPYFSLFGEDTVPDRAAGPEAAESKGGTWRWLHRLIEEKRPGYDEQWRRYRANYCGMLRLIDDQIRRFAAHLTARELFDNTLFVVLADHGDYVGDYGLQRKGAGMPECLMRIPFVVSGQGIVRGDNEQDFVSLVDILPTLCEIAGQDIPYGVQGRSLWPLLSGAEYPSAEFASIYAEGGYGGLPYETSERPPMHFDYAGPTFDELNDVTQSGVTKMLRRGKWKLIYDLTRSGELYDLEEDPAELLNRFDDPEYAAVRTELVEELLWWTLRATDDLPLAKYTPKRSPHNWYAPHLPVQPRHFT